jgi:ubiquinone/menaquinone biosynthesis C-methylase UbiE
MSVRFLQLLATFCLCLSANLIAQETSVNPGINASFISPDAKEFIEKFEIESREVFSRRTAIVKACRIDKGVTLADIGAGTGLFTRLFADEVGPDGRVLAVDIAKNFLEYIDRINRESGRNNVQTLQCSAEATMLPPLSVDVAYICDTYHHFEFPLKTMRSVHAAMKPSGRVILIDFKRIEGETKEWTMNHVRAGQEVFEEELRSCGFRKIREHTEILKENYFVEFEKGESLK